MYKLKNELPPLSSLLPFEAAARLGSITEAASELNLTQAAISRQIKALEDNLGIQLFERRNRAIHVTKEGKEFQQVISESMHRISLFSSQLRDPDNKNDIILLTQLCEGFYWLLPNLSSFYQAHPDISVKVTATTKPISTLSEPFDLAFQTTSREQGMYQPILTVDDYVFPVCSPDYLEKTGDIGSIASITDHHLLHHKTDPQDWIEWNDWLSQIGEPATTAKKGSFYENYLLVIQAAIEGHGIALGWGRTTKTLIEAGNLVKPFDESLHLPKALSLYRHPYKAHRAETDMLIEWFQKQLGQP